MLLATSMPMKKFVIHTPEFFSPRRLTGLSERKLINSGRVDRTHGCARVIDLPFVISTERDSLSLLPVSCQDAVSDSGDTILSIARR